MTKLRLATYTGLSMLLGGLAQAWYDHLPEGFTLVGVVNIVIVAALVATLSVMGRRDTRRGIVHDQREEEQ